MKYKQLQVGEQVITNHRQIEKCLNEHNLYWLMDAEFENASICIINNTLVWEYGTWYSGIWEYGIWKKGDFLSGKWINGIFESGNFTGEFISGIITDAIINNVPTSVQTIMK